MIEEKKFLSPTRLRIYSPADLEKNWFVEYYLGKKRVRKYGLINQFRTYQKRMEEAQRLLNEIKQLQIQEPCQVKEKIYSQLTRLKPTYRKKTYQTIKSKVDTFYNFAGDRYTNKKLVEDFFLWLLQERHPSTYYSYRAQLLKLFREVGEGQLFENIEIRKKQHNPAKYFSRSQIQALKKEIRANNPDLWHFIEFIFYCFIRPGELRQLRREDIFLGDRIIRISSKISKNKKTEHITIPMAFNPDWINQIEGGYIFQGKNGRPIGLNTMARRHRSIIKKMGMSSEYKLYSWKHTGAVMAVKAGIGLKQLQIQLRHSSLDMTDRYLRQMGVNDLEQLKNNFPGI